MISSLTFPEYFLKEQKPDILIDPALDVNLFGTFIAPAFNISKRFVGTEPDDKVKSQYNRCMEITLPKYGITLYEIERLNKDGVTVSATRVREWIKKKDIENLHKFLPDSTFEIIKRSRYI